ncbi:hypothetical protein HYQ46_011115 [Verticillium longisporum]|nr:hypothetical protein HYQ46_011115 [Verticillium longisporum]
MMERRLESMSTKDVPLKKMGLGATSTDGLRNKSEQKTHRRVLRTAFNHRWRHLISLSIVPTGWSRH